MIACVLTPVYAHLASSRCSGKALCCPLDHSGASCSFARPRPREGEETASRGLSKSGVSSRAPDLRGQPGFWPLSAGRGKDEGCGRDQLPIYPSHKRSQSKGGGTSACSHPDKPLVEAPISFRINCHRPCYCRTPFDEHSVVSLCVYHRSQLALDPTRFVLLWQPLLFSLPHIPPLPRNLSCTRNHQAWHPYLHPMALLQSRSTTRS